MRRLALWPVERDPDVAEPEIAWRRWFVLYDGSYNDIARGYLAPAHGRIVAGEKAWREFARDLFKVDSVQVRRK